MSEFWYEGNWWKAFNYDAAKNVGAFNYEKDGVTVMIRLTEQERESARADLELLQAPDRKAAFEACDVADERLPKGSTMIGWDYGCRDAEDDPLLMIYRDDRFSVSLPHAAALELLDVLRKSAARTP
jgi:hypothetical protein